MITKCVHEVETYCKYYSVQLTSLNNKGEARTQSSRTRSYSGIPRLHFDNLDTSRTNWNVQTCTFPLPKGAGHGHSLGTGAVFRPANQELQYYRSSEDAEFSKVPFSNPKTYSNVLLQKNGAWHGPMIAVFTQCFQSWRYTTETESSNCQTTSPDRKLLKRPTKELAVRGKLHY